MECLEERALLSANGGYENEPTVFVSESLLPTGATTLDTPSFSSITGDLSDTEGYRDITLEWEEVTGASSYTISYATNEEFSDLEIIEEIEGTSTTISLDDAETYYFSIQAFDSNGNDSLESTTVMVPATPVFSLINGNTSTNGITIKTETGEVYNADSYNILYGNEGDWTEITGLHFNDFSGDGFYVGNLVPGTTQYTFQFKAISSNTSYDSGWSDKDIAFSGSILETPGVIAETAHPGITLTITPITSADSYTIKYKPSSATDWTTSTSTTTTVTMDTLTSGVSYDFTVQAVNETEDQNSLVSASVTEVAGAALREPLTFTITTAGDTVADDGYLSLREAIAGAIDGDTIVLGDGIGAITLSTPIDVNANITMGDGFSITGNGTTIFTVNSAKTMTFNNVTLNSGAISGGTTTFLGTTEGSATNNSSANYLGSDTQTIYAGNYDDLTITGSGTKTLAGNITADSLTIHGSGLSDIVTLNGASNTITVPAANVSVQWATLNNTGFTNPTTINSYDNIAGTNTVIASGTTTGATIALTADSIAANTPLIYGATLDTLVLTATYNIQGEVVTDTNGTTYGVIKTSANAQKNAATYTETLAVYNSSTATTQYSLANTEASITYTVNPRPLTLTGTTTVNSKVYDNNTSGTFSSTKTLSNVVSGDTVNLSAAATFPSASVGTYSNVLVIYTITGDATTLSNYVVPTYTENTTATITAATLSPETITINQSTDIIYDGQSHDVVINGLYEGDIVTRTYTKIGTGPLATGVLPKDAGAYSLVITIQRENYSSWTSNPTVNAIVIAPKPLTIETPTTITTKAYDGTNTATVNVGNIVGIVDGDTVEVSGAATFSGTNAALYNETVTYSVSGTSASNYDAPAQEVVACAITPKQLTIDTPTIAEKVYNGNTDAEITFDTATLGGLVGTETLTVSAVGSFPNAVVGNYSIPVSFSLTKETGNTGLVNNYYAPVSVTVNNVAITNAEITGITVHPGPITYDKMAHAIAVTGTLPGDIIYYTYNGETSTTVPSFTGAGNYSISVKIKRANYNDWTLEAVNFGITPKELTVTGTTVNTKTYNKSTDTTFSGQTLSGVISGDTVNLTVTGSFESANAGTHNVATTYSIDNSNYTLASNSATLTGTILKKQLTISASTVADKNYDGTTNTTINMGTPSGIEEGDTVNVAASAAFPSSNVKYNGSEVDNYIVPITYTINGADAKNYLAPVASSDQAKINPLTIEGITTSGGNYAYTRQAQTATITYDQVTYPAGAPAGDTYSYVYRNITTPETPTQMDSAPVNVGTYEITVTVHRDNYTDLTTAPVTVTITPIAVSLVGVTVADKTYDGDATATQDTTNAFLLGIIGGDTVTYSDVTTAFENKNVGGHVIPVTCTLGGADAGNYTFTPVNIAASINPMPLTISGSTVTPKVYDGSTTAEVTGTTISPITGDDVSVSATGSFSDANVGENKTVYVTYRLTGNDSGNYSIVPQTTLQGTITNADFDGIDMVNYTGVYDSEEHTIIINGLMADDTVTYGYAYVDTNGDTQTASDLAVRPKFEHAGTYTVNATVHRANYNDYVVPSATITISKKSFTVTRPTVQSTKVYDGNTSATLIGGSVDGKITGDDLEITTTGTYDNANVGNTHVVTVSYGLTGTDAENYNVPESFTVNNVEITAATITDVNADFYTGFTYDQQKHNAVELSGTGLLATDTVVVSYNGGNYNLTDNILQFKDAGTYSITVTVSRDNYNDWTQTSDVTILQKQLLVEGSSVADKTYDGTTSATPTLGTVSDLYTGDNVTITPHAVFPNKNVKYEADAIVDYSVSITYTISGDHAANYLAPVPSSDTAKIDLRELTVTGTTISDKIYDGNTNATISRGTLSGYISGDSLTVTANGVFDSKNVGTYEIVVSYAIAGADATNYSAPENNTITGVTITQRPLTVEGTTASNKTYDGNTTVTEYSLGSVSNLVDGDTVVITPTGTFDDANVGIHTVTFTYETSGTDAGNYTKPSQTTTRASILKASARNITINSADAEYDGDTHSPSITGTVTGDTIYYTWNGFTTNNAPEFTDAGTYSVYVMIKNPNYTNYRGSTSITIRKVELTVTGTTVANKVYDRTTNATINYSGVTGVVGTDDVTVVPHGTFDNVNVGEGKAVAITYTLTGAKARNYTAPAANNSLTANITPKQLTISGTTAKHKAYDGNTNAEINMGSVVGIYSGDDVTVTLTSATFESATIGPHPVTIKYALSGNENDIKNYTAPVDDTVNASITNAVSNITVTGNGTFTYDRNNHTIQVLGTEEDDSVSVTYTNSIGETIEAPKNVGTYTASVYVTRSNHTTYTSTREIKIEPQTLTVSGTSVVQRDYNKTTAATFSGATLSGVIDGDTVSVNVAGSFPSANAGTYDIAATFSLTGADAGNYTLSNPTATLSGTIARKQLTIDGTSVSGKVFDGTNTVEATLGTVTGIVNGDNDNINITASATLDDRNVGNRTATVIYSISNNTENDIAANYIAPVQQTFENITVSKATINDVSISGYTGTYDGAAHSITVNSQLSDTISYSISDSWSETKPEYTNAGTYIVNVRISRGDNYETWAGTATVTIHQLRLTISDTTVNTKTYDGTTAATVTLGTLTNTIGSDEVIILPTGVFDNANAGNSHTVTVGYTISGGAAKGNYLAPTADTFNDITISKKQLTITGTVVSGKVFDNTNTATVTTVGTVSGIISADKGKLSVTASATFENYNVGNQAANVTYALENLTEETTAANYIAPEDATISNLQITPATITAISVEGFNGPYDSTPHSITVSGNLTGDVIKYIYNGQTLDATPTFTEVGQYNVNVRVTRDNYNPWTGSATVVITESSQDDDFSFASEQFESESFDSAPEGIVNDNTFEANAIYLVSEKSLNGNTPNLALNQGVRKSILSDQNVDSFLAEEMSINDETLANPMFPVDSALIDDYDFITPNTLENYIDSNNDPETLSVVLDEIMSEESLSSYQDNIFLQR